ncbi:hybrid sensor histidine kinase/response regulator [Massilia sp. SM-13]|uniref:hybrid sensor histidine kinase/response regulator n=1 Tax=Pseudoduganella rhizocola TaxID=3382643 RepID=UPI0038B4A24A
MNKADLSTSSTPPFDPDPLSWVMVEIREALGRSKTALFEAGGRDPEDQATALQHAKSHLHQAHGALQMVDVDGVVLVTGLAEQALERFRNGTLKANADNAQIVANLYQALIEYLQELLAGAPFQPVRLFPYYRDAQIMLGVERVHPADLFFPDLSQAPELPAAPGADGADYAALRQRFERALLPFLKASDAAGPAAALRDAIQAVADAQQDSRARAFWCTMQAFAELVASGQLEGGLYVKQLFGMINLQLRRLSQGVPELPEAMQRDALFFIAAADAGQLSPLARQLRSAYALDGMVPQDYEVRRYGQLDEEALRRAGEALAQAQSAWQRIEQADAGPEQQSAFTHALAALAAASDKLGLAPLAALMRQLAKVSEHAHARLTPAEAGRSAGAAQGSSEELGLEMARALLFAEHHLGHIRHLPDDFTAHADNIGARLQALLAGETPPAPAQWQNSMAQQDETVVALAMEMKTSLRQVEKVLDEFHADPSRRAELGALDAVLHQLEGALSMLDLYDATQAAAHVRSAVAALAQGGDAARALDDIAQNVGALGFFVDMLAQNAAGAQERFVFDAEQGTFRAVPFRKIAGPESIPVLDQQVPSPPPPSPAEPPAAGDDAGVEAELLEIFIGEAQDVLASVDMQLNGPHAALESLEGLTVLRRSFHTLKGSARMVGLSAFADAAASLERVMNVWLAEERAASADLLALLEWAAPQLRAWVAELAAAGASRRDAAAIMRAADGVQQDGAFVLPATEDAAAELDAFSAAPDKDAGDAASIDDAAAPGAPIAEDDAATTGAARGEAVAGAPAAPGATDSMGAVHAAGGGPETPGAAQTGNVIGLPVATAPTPVTPSADDNVKFVGRLAIPLPLYNIYLAESDELVRHLARDFGEWRHEPRRPVSAQALHAAHTLAGTSGTVGFKALRELAFALETALQVVQAPAPQLDPAQHDLLDFTVERIRQMLQSFAAGDMPDEQPELIAALAAMARELAQPRAEGALNARLDSIFADAASEPAPQDDLEARLNALFTATYHALLADPPPMPERGAELRPRPQLAKQDESIDDLFNAAFDDAFAAPPLTQVAPPPLPPMPVPEPEPAEPPGPVPAPAIIDELMALPADEPAGQDAPEITQAPELEALQDHTPVPQPTDAPVADAGEAVAHAAEDATEPTPAAEAGDAEAARDVAATAAAAADSAASTNEIEPEVELLALPAAEAALSDGAPAAIADDIDPDLLPVFLEEGADLLPQVGEALRAWHNAPTDIGHAHTLQRVLHTVKGSARMAGAMRLGQHAHEIETHVENMVHAGSVSPLAFDELMAHYDHALLLFEQLQNPAPAEAPQQEQEPAPEAADPAARQAMVRVRADLLDRLVNQAGEVSITRSRLENEVGVLRTSLADFQDNLDRLRRHLREVEMQAETQIASRLSISGEREFDPLEFDRFTRLQELTRMMAESVNDVSAFHDSLIRSVDAASDDLTQQARMTRDLQRYLMRVRMVPFASISERLFRVARQSAKEVDKRVNLDIRGSTVEMDRGVLERMAGPFEHLLRNAIVHGIEARSERAAHGKQETGELLVEVSQQGNEVVLEFSDDGAGLDLARIRAKAQQSGLLAGADISDADAANLIFEPGFSTADTLTELAGRGVGMDIVRAEASALGGRVDTWTEAGKGTRFTIHLPLTLAVTQVVLLAAGGKTYAVPSALVEQVLQMKEGALAEANAAGMLTLQGQSAALHYLPALLGDAAARPLAQRSAPVLMLRSGTDRLALHADEILGNREVVIKNIGPQLARVPGIAGATVLGNGEIVLILNPIVLAQQPGRALPQTPAPAQAEGVIMVVDDSITVRKVTQRLLEREGYTVILAKDGVDALEQVHERRPDLMLVDIEMPRMDGFDLTRNIRGDDATREIPIIMITSRSADKHRNYALQLGVNAYFGKPFQEPILLGAIAGLMPKKP